VGSSNVAIVTIQVAEVNDVPVARNDARTTDEDVPLVFSASELTANDSAGPANETGQTLTVTQLVAGPDAHGTVSLAEGVVRFSPDRDFQGPAAFGYTLCDDGTTAGLPDPKCATGTVEVMVTAANDAPVFTSVPGVVTTAEGTLYSFAVQATDVDGPALTFSLVGAPAGAAIDSLTGQLTWTPTEAQGGTGAPYLFKVRVSDGLASADTDVSVTVTEVNAPPVLAVASSFVVLLGDVLSFAAVGTDADVPVQALSYGLGGSAPAGATIGATTGLFTWTPTTAQAGATHTFDVVVSDGIAATPVSVTVAVLGPQNIERGVLAGTRALRQIITDPNDRRALDQVIGDLSRAVDSPAWIDASHLQPGRGQEVFDATGRAVRELVRLQGDPRSTLPDAVLQRLVDLLVRATRLLAEIAIEEVVATGDARELASAIVELVAGDFLATSGRPADAVGHYGLAWQHATRARR
jgi:cadherin-like protein/putative Ig domain-containing protein